jgi:hypothetical protein
MKINAPLDPNVHKTLIVGCGHAFWDGKTDESVAASTFLGHPVPHTPSEYLVCLEEEVCCAPDLACDINKVGELIAAGIFGEHKFDYILFENFPQNVLQLPTLLWLMQNHLSPAGILIYTGGEYLPDLDAYVTLVRNDLFYVSHLSFDAIKTQAMPPAVKYFFDKIYIVKNPIRGELNKFFQDSYSILKNGSLSMSFWYTSEKARIAMEAAIVQQQPENSPCTNSAKSY